MSTARQNYIATLLPASALRPHGKVLVAGGDTGTSGSIFAFGAPLASAELYDPDTGLFSVTGSMSAARILHAATLLTNGTLLVSGGGDPVKRAGLARAELYSPPSSVPTPVLLSLAG